MKRVFEEISDEEWENHSFKPSRVLRKNPDHPPPIESFAFNSLAQPTLSDQSSDDCVEVQHLDGDSNLEDYDVEPDDTGPVNRARRFIVDDDDDEGDDDDDVNDGDENGFEEVYDVESSEEELQEDDVVGKALQKCAKISAELRKELYGSSGASCERYAEVEASSVRIVTQNDIDIACGVVDSNFQPILKPYQLVGVNFLLLLHQQGIGGAILADEMGLGKTIQAITYLTLLNHLKNDPGPHLIVCPASLLENWERELKKWCPSFSVLQYHGAGRAAYSKELSSLSKAGLPPPFNVLLVCYSLFERHSVQQKDDRKILKQFMMPDLFATEDVDLKKLLNAEDRELIGRMKSILGPFILRRLKSDVMQQLVPKIQQVQYVIMEKQQENAYREAIEEYRTISRAQIAKLSESDLNNIVGIIPRRQISNYFVQFRKIANHPLLVRRIYNDDDVVCFAKRLHSMGVYECTLGRVVEELKNYSDFSIHQLLLRYGITGGKGTLSDEHVMLSAKCQTLAELLPSLKRTGHRVLIFSQWTSMLDILEWTLDVIGVTYRRLDGSTQVTDRQTIVDDFNNDTSIFACLLSTRAGGQGLNLTGADTVVIHDMDFNPQIDRQAEDRCHRIGQTRPVTIYRLVTKDTVDENVYEIAKRKLTLDAAVLECGMDVGNEDDTSQKTMGQILSSLLMS
ncbi:Protein CHROMATIN REMODELING 19 [Hibiscus syriacus]|uniref:Protein CHROMATIN REMODELING 19 n=1 Tax=Hibiscus syriacus TaxID=106335 RepID=A0A6A3BK14_HIBSY|nr:Protein CHROMATIN REMODELING 19 [Hibiscus syriacus]